MSKPANFRRRVPIALLWLALLVLPALQAQGPAWWGTRGVLDPAKSPSDYSPATQGQLKYVAKAAMDEINATQLQGAGPGIIGVVGPWLQSSNISLARDYSTVTVGQLKYVAKPFYVQLGLTLPSSETAADDNDFAIATLGQLKFVFNFEIGTSTPAVAIDQNLSMPEEGYLPITLSATGVTPETTYSVDVTSTNPAHGELLGTPPYVTYVPYAHYVGTDSFTFKVTKGGVNSIGTVNLTITPINHPPLVYAGSFQEATGSTLELNGVITDIDGAPPAVPVDTITSEWSKVDGPGTVDFEDAQALVTTATFSAPGDYHLILRASDGHYSRSDTLLVTVPSVAPPPTITAITLAAAPSTLYLPSATTLSVTLTPSNASYTKIEFYEGSRRISPANAALTSMQWTPSHVGSYELTARVYNGSAYRVAPLVPVHVWALRNGVGYGGFGSTGNGGNSTSGGSGGTDPTSTNGPGGGGSTGGGDPTGGNVDDDPNFKDTDGDGLTDKREEEMGTDFSSKDTDNDEKEDGEEAWPNQKLLTVPRTSDSRFAAIDLTTIGFPSTIKEFIGLDDNEDIAYSAVSEDEDHTVEYFQFKLNKQEKTPVEFTINSISRNGYLAGTDDDDPLNTQGVIMEIDTDGEPTPTSIPFSKTAPPGTIDVVTNASAFSTNGSLTLLSGSLNYTTGSEDHPTGADSYNGAFIFPDPSETGPPHYSHTVTTITYDSEGTSTSETSIADAGSYLEMTSDSKVNISNVIAGSRGLFEFGHYDTGASVSHSHLAIISDSTALNYPDYQFVSLADPYNDDFPSVVLGADYLGDDEIFVQKGDLWPHEPLKYWNTDTKKLDNMTVGHTGNDHNESDGKINRRGEIISGTSLFRNALKQDFSKLLPEDVEIESISDINNLGAMLGKAKFDGESKPALLLPCEFSIYPADPYADVPGQPNAPKPSAKDITRQVSADEANIYLQANVFLPAKDEEDDTDKMMPVEDESVVRWEIRDGSAGGGSLEEPETETEDGFAAVKLTTSHHAGDLYKIKAKLIKVKKGAKTIETDVDHPLITVETGVIEVVPGAAHTIAVTTEDGSTMPADGKTEKQITATITDAWGNPVAGGTAVYWHVKGEGTLLEAAANTDIEGKATATLVAGDVPGDQVVSVEADALSQDTTVQNTVLGGSITSSATSLDTATGQTATLTANFTGAANGAKVNWYTTKGEILNASTQTSGGQATATLRATNTRLGDALVFASIGGNVKMARVNFTTSSPIKIVVAHPLIAADATADGTDVLTNVDGTTTSISYHAGSDVTISAPGYGGYQATVQVGQIQSTSTIHFGLNAASSGQVQDDSATFAATLSGADIDTLLPQSGTASLSFPLATATASIANNATFQSQQSLQVSAWVRPSGSLAANLVTKAGEYSLQVDSTGHPKFTVTSSGGSTTVTADAAIPDHEWTLVKGQIRADGTISVSEANSVKTAAISGTLVTTSNPVVIGGSGFVGHLDEVAFESGSNFGSPVTPSYTLGGLDGSNHVTLDSQGNATIQIHGNGSAGTAAQIARRLAIDVSINPHINVESAVVVAPKGDIVNIVAADQQLKPNGQAFSGSDVEELAARQLGDANQSGQRVQAVPLMRAPSVEANAKMGEHITLYAQNVSDAAGQISAIMRVNVSGVSAEVQARFNAQLTRAYQAACASGNDAQFVQYVQDHMEECVKALHNMSASQPEAFVSYVRITDGRFIYDKICGVGQTYGAELIEDLGKINADEHLQTNFLQKTISLLSDGLDALANVAKWKTAAFNGAEGWLRVTLQKMVADGAIDHEDAFSIGCMWGVLDVANGLSDAILDVKQTAQLFAHLISTVAKAAVGDVDARSELKAMIPQMSGYQDTEEAFDKWQSGEYFDSGTAATKAAIAVGSNLTFIAGLTLKAGAFAILVRKISKEAKGKLLQWIGHAGETHLKKIVEAECGYRNVISLANDSNQGIDLVAFTKDGDVVVMEAKSHAFVGKPRLSKKQKPLRQWALDNLDEIRQHPERYTEEQVGYAKNIQKAINDGKALHTVVVNLDDVIEAFPNPYVDVATAVDKIKITCYIWRNGKLVLDEWPPNL